MKGVILKIARVEKQISS